MDFERLLKILHGFGGSGQVYFVLCTAQIFRCDSCHDGRENILTLKHIIPKEISFSYQILTAFYGFGNEPKQKIAFIDH